MEGFPQVMTQVAPYPSELQKLVASLEYREGWSFGLRPMDRGQGCEGLTFVVHARVKDSVGGVYDGVNRGDTIVVGHYFPVPAAAYNRSSWKRWLLDRVLDVEQHEACEFFRVDGEREFAPHHSEGEDPYTIWHIGDLETARKRSSDR